MRHFLRATLVRHLVHFLTFGSHFLDRLDLPRLQVGLPRARAHYVTCGRRRSYPLSRLLDFILLVATCLA